MQPNPKTGRFHRKDLFRLLVVLAGVLGSSSVVYFGPVIVLGTGEPIIIVASNSMEPAIDAGDLITVQRVASSQISLGSVIVYQKSLSNIRVVHRIICIVTRSSANCQNPWYPYLACFTPPCYYTKGDNDFAPDPWLVLSDEILAVWTGFRAPYLGMTILCLRQDLACPSPWAIVSVIALGTVVLSAIAIDLRISRTRGKSGQSKTRDDLIEP